MSGPRSVKRKAVVSRRQVPGHQHAFSAWELTLSCGHKVTRTHSGKGAIAAAIWKSVMCPRAGYMTVGFLKHADALKVVRRAVPYDTSTAEHGK